MSYYYCKYCKDYKKESHDCYRKSSKCDRKYVKVKCCDDKKEELVRASAFRAVNTVNQPVLANTPVKVLFQNEQFDLANEYNPVTSIFTPKTRGVYNVLG
ncbi:complement C1q domain-containing protein, partial [Bacillus cereus]|nr:complement C1q domain-containing protein [Bacillus cereus]